MVQFVPEAIHSVALQRSCPDKAKNIAGTDAHICRLRAIRESPLRKSICFAVRRGRRTLRYDTNSFFLVPKGHIAEFNRL